MTGLGLLALGGAALTAWLLLEDAAPKKVTRGRVTIEPRVPYRYTFQTFETLTLSADMQTDVRVELITLSAYDVVFGHTPGLAGGAYTVSFTRVSPISVTLDIGATLASTGTFGPSLRLLSVERLDGKAI